MMHSLQIIVPHETESSDYNLGAVHKGRPHGGWGFGPMRTDADGGLGHADVRKLALMLPLIHSANTVFTLLVYN